MSTICLELLVFVPIPIQNNTCTKEQARYLVCSCLWNEVGTYFLLTHNILDSILFIV
jgi:hypothetical protein